MLAKILTCAVVGMDGALVEVEVDIGHGLPAFAIVGLPDTAVNEAKERVRAAIRNSGGTFPLRRITVNLAPADLRKAGPAYDLPIAVGILIASEQVAQTLPDISPFSEQYLVLGELGLDGSLRHTRGVLPMVALARELGISRVLVPAVNAAEAALVGEDVAVYPVTHLRQLMDHLRGDRLISTYVAPPSRQGIAGGAGVSRAERHVAPGDMADIRGQEHAKRALEVAAAGNHNLLLYGPPGSGKTLLARTLPSLLPPLSRDEALEATRIYSIAGLLPEGEPLLRQRPFRSPHHTISHAGLVGGGRWPRPGEISLAHRGVLFLDEMPEFSQRTLEVLRQPLEDRVVTISRAHGSVTFPANFMLVASMNPCPCGFLGDPGRDCRCSAGAISRYQKRISGPLLDRIDMQVEMPRVEYQKLTDRTDGESSQQVRMRVELAYLRQRERFGQLPQVTYNAGMGPAEVQAFCSLETAAEPLLAIASDRLCLSARAIHRVLKLARTIADLAGSETIAAAHVAEALQYRPRLDWS